MSHRIRVSFALSDVWMPILTTSSEQYFASQKFKTCPWAIIIVAMSLNPIGSTFQRPNQFKLSQKKQNWLVMSLNPNRKIALSNTSKRKHIGSFRRKSYRQTAVIKKSTKCKYTLFLRLNGHNINYWGLIVQWNTIHSLKWLS